jgi:mannose-6-phosphate isomerase-like protein (cupin superfamily)
MNNLSSPAARKPSVPVMDAYRVGDRDERPWGHYVVTGVGIDANGEEYCEKIITVRPGEVLSLQSHNLRRETWTVQKGILTALRDGERLEALSGESIHIPKGSLHCMANLDEDDCVIKERQEGICREDDIKRYIDAYNRGAEAAPPAAAAKSFSAYHDILSDIRKISANRMQGVPY